MQHLGAVKDYLLLARGDFYQCFLADAAKLLASPPREKTANSDLGVNTVQLGSLQQKLAALHRLLPLHKQCSKAATPPCLVQLPGTCHKVHMHPELCWPQASLRLVAYKPSWTLPRCFAPVHAAVPWQSAAMKSTAQNDPHFKLFRLVLRPKTSKQQQQQGSQAPGGASSTAPAGGRALMVPSYDSLWDDLALEAEMPWPLGVLLTPRHMERYNALFQLLLRLKRVQLALEQAWQELGR